MSRAFVGVAVLLAGAMGCLSNTGVSDPLGHGGSGQTGNASGSAGTTGSGNSSGSGNTTGSAGTTGSGNTTGSAGTTGSGNNTGSAGTTGSGNNTGSAGTTGSGGTGTAGTGSAGHTGAGGATGGGGATGSGGAGSGCSSAQICDDFETGTLNTAIWKQMNGGFTATVASDPMAHSGSHDLHISAPNTSSSAFISETKTFPASDFWGRAWLKFNSVPGGHQMHIYVAIPGDQLRLLNRLTNDAIQVNFQKTDKFYGSKTVVPQNMWFCYEWHVTASATTIYKDGTQLTDIVAPGATGATALYLGYQRFATVSGSTATADMWIDDVAVDTKQIGCK